MTKRFSSTTLKTAFVKSIPIFCSYVFVSMAYGMMMASAGFPWYDSLLVSLTVYTGAFQFVLITFLSSGASLITIALTALLLNSRQSFYSLTFLKEFKQMGRRKLYMIHTMTDETYAVNCTLDLPKKEKEDTMFLVALFSRCYWMIGSVIGGILGQIIPFDLTGIDFCMTALFLIIFIDQWEKAKKHTPALTGLGIGILCLLIFGENRFMLPALLIVSALLLLFQRKETLA
ncbi:branched-chain amino acid ABC transporter permease [Fusicatenibacter saccharivorans]|uniref:AzlC family ABC transporter permease n=1 Tax=Fusicatenibacter saccharivorans TaxID=1150298 RepID=UPI00156E7D1E|nr:AzlC family ABC transporter permease [Fusicatenibacter saccharivorans]NSF06869.1 branched-chain amino acid ABC transporter permease [Fusicatenibacter saccharivorans]